MKRLFKTKRNESPTPPQLPISPGRHTGVIAGPSDLSARSDASLEDERSGMNPQIEFQEWAGEDQELPASGAWVSAFETGDTGSGSEPTVEGTRNTKDREIESMEGSRIAKTADAGTLSEGLKEATEGFGPLKIILQAIHTEFYANRQGTAAAAENKIEGLIPRVVALEEHFGSCPGDVEEQRRREELILELKDIEGRLLSSSNDLGLRWLPYQVQDDEDTFRILEDLRESIFRYQMTQQMATNDRGLRRMDPAEAAVVNSFRCAKQAEYRHGNRGRCLKGTRRAILDEIELWTRNLDKPPVYWLNGLAGTGKSTISQTIAERTFADARLGASFFCSRDFEDRSDLKLIFPTIAVQLARTYPEFRSIFVPLVRSDPEIAYESLYGQMNRLIVQPLVKAAISTVIVIDALDECKDDEPASAILSVLEQFVAKIPKVKFFVTGRPEPRIRDGFQLPLLIGATDVFVLHEVEPSQVNDDIRSFFRESFSKLSRRRGLDAWPSEEQLDLLCERSSGLFVYAVAAVRFIDQRNKNPERQLDRLLQSPESSAYVGKTKFKENMTLDLLYITILQEAFDDDSAEDDPGVRSVLGAVVLATNPLSPSAIAAILGFDVKDVFPLLLSAHSLLALQDNIDHPVRPFHKSFPDFIIDPTRCSNPRLRVHPPDQHAELLFGCLEVMNRELERNMCKLPDGVANSEVVDLGDKVGRYVGQALQYACRSWHKHLVDTIPLHIASVLHKFLEKKFLFWLEVLSVLGAAREAVDALVATARCKWPDVSATVDLARDCFRFAISSFEIITTSAPHIYHSALPLSPQTSIVHELYKQYARPFVRIVRGLPVSWDPVVATANHGVSLEDAVWSPCSRFIAFSAPDQVLMVFDAVTLNQLNTFESTFEPTLGIPSMYSFSPDSRFLTEIYGDRFLGWDLQTGRPVGTILSGLPRNFMPLSSTYSADGKILATAYRPQKMSSDWIEAVGDPLTTEESDFINTYDLSKMRKVTYRVSEGSLAKTIWTHGEHLRFATTEEGRITIWEVAFTFIRLPTEVASFPIPYGTSDTPTFLFHPTPPRLAFTLEGKILVWDVEASHSLLESGQIRASDTVAQSPSCSFKQSSFSSDGRFFANMTDGLEVYLWKESPTGYTLHQILPFSSAVPVCHRPYLSPNGESVAVVLHHTIHRWPTIDQILSPSGIPIKGGTRPFILAFSPSETLAAFVRREGNAVVVLDLQSGNPRLIIDTGMEVCCLGVAEGAVAVVGREGKIATWDLPAKNGILNARVNIDSSVRTTMLGTSARSQCISISPDLSRVAIIPDRGDLPPLEVRDAQTGRFLAAVKYDLPLETLSFTPNGRGIWGMEQFSTSWRETWEILQGSKPDCVTLKLSSMDTAPRLHRHPRQRHEVTDDGWILSPTRRRLLRLPSYWALGKRGMTWSERYLGLGYGILPEVVILEFPE